MHDAQCTKQEAQHPNYRHTQRLRLLCLQEQGSSVLREDSSSRMGSFHDELEESSLSGGSQGDSGSGNVEELIEALEARATRAPALPIGAGDALYDNLTQADEGQKQYTLIPW